MVKMFCRIGLIVVLNWAVASYADDNLQNDVENDVIFSDLTNQFIYKYQPDSTNRQWEIIINPIHGFAPTYPGSDILLSQTNLNAEIANISGESRFFINSTKGLGFNVIETPSWIAGTSINYVTNFSYDPTASITYSNNFRSKEFLGLENFPNTAASLFFANYLIDQSSFGATVYKTLGQLEGGGYYQISFTHAALITTHWLINLSTNLQYDDATYMQALFGVTNTESRASGLATYYPHSGWDSIAYSITPLYKINKSWSITSSVIAITYLDQVASSPLIVHKQNYEFLLGVIYNIFF